MGKALSGWITLLWRDKFAFVAVLFLLLEVCFALFGPALLGDAATKMNLKLRNTPPLTSAIDHGWLYVFGGDALGRSILARIIVASQNTLGIVASAVPLALIFGCFIGLIAGFKGGWLEHLVMRLTDIVMSFPSLLLAVVVLYVFEPSVANLVMVLAITRLPIYIRTTRAEVLEIRQRLFIDAARALGFSNRRIVFRHIAPVIFPTLITIATLDCALVMLAESALSFLGIGIQPPEVTWGLMVAQGRNYLSTAWWLAFFPGLMIMLTTLALNLTANWLRVVADPVQRWRLLSGGQ